MADDTGKKIVIGAPTVAGGAVALSRFKKERSLFGAPTHSLPETTSAVRRFVSQYGQQGTGIYQNWQLEKLASLAENVTLSTIQLKDVWRRASKIADPSGALSAALNKRLTGDTPQQVMQDIISVLRNNSSLYTRRTAGVFIQDVETLSQLVKQGVDISTRSLPIDLKQKIAAAGGLSPHMQQSIKMLETKLGVEIDPLRISREGYPGTELQLRMKGARIGGTATLAVPGVFPTMPTIATRGVSQQSRYLAGMYGIVEGGVLQGTFNHEEWMLRRATEDLVPEMLTRKKLSNRKARQLVHGFETRMAENLEWVQSIPSGHHAGWDEWIKLRSQIMRLRTPGGKPLDPFEYANIIEQGGLKTAEGGFLSVMPGYSPSHIASSVVSTHDYRGISSLIGWSEETGRRPMQWLRPEYAPTAAAMEQMKSINQLTERFDWAATRRGVTSPIVRAAYISSKYAPELQSLGITTEGMGVISSGLREAREVERITTMDVATTGLSKRFKELLGGGRFSRKQFTDPFYLPEGMFLGLGPEGRPVVSPADLQLVEAVAFRDRSKGKFLRLLTKETLPPSEYEKVYLGGKMMAEYVQPGYIQDVMQRTLGAGHLKNVGAIITMDELKKNRRLFYNQMFSSLWEYTKRVQEKGGVMGFAAREFAEDPMKAIRYIEAQSRIGGSLFHEKALNYAWEIGRQAKLPPHQIGTIFGAVPEVIGEGWQMWLPHMTAIQEKKISRGIAESFTQLFYGGPGGPGAGGRATIEPRGYELLGAPHYGAVGGEIQAEIAYRMMHRYPEALEEQKVLGRSLGSILERKQIGGAMGAGEMLSGITGGMTLPAEEAALSIRGIGDIVIPSEGFSRQFAARMTAAGTRITSPLAGSYRDLIETAAGYESGQVNRVEMERALERLTGEVSSYKAATVTGPGGLLRNKVPGSRFLTAVTPTAGIQLADEFTIGITKNYAEKMFEDMEQIYGRTEMSKMRGQFMAGETINAIAARHPFIGPYSTQPVKAQLVPGKGAYAVVNEMLRKVSTTDIGKGVTDLGMMRFSPLVGMAGDTDGDIISVMFAGPQLEKSLSAHMGKQTSLDLYEQYSIRSQLLKAGAAGGNIPLQTAMAGDMLKLGIPATELPRVSLALQRARAAVLHQSRRMTVQSSMDALQLLEWLEQTPISGKHIPPERASEMIDMFYNIEESVKKKNANMLADTARQVLATADTATKRTIGEGLNVAVEDIAGGAIRNVRIPGIRIEETSKIITDALRAAEVVVHGQTTSAQMRDFLMGRTQPTGARGAAEMLSQEALAASPFGALIEPQGLPGVKGMAAKMSARAMATANRLVSAGERALQHSKPLLIGGTISLGLATLLSRPKQTLSPLDIAAPSPEMRSGTGGAHLSADTVVPPEPLGSPTAPNLTSVSNTGRISAKQGRRVSVRGTSPAGLDYQSINSNIQQLMGGSAQIHSTVNDLRSSLTEQRVSDILNR